MCFKSFTWFCFLNKYSYSRKDLFLYKIPFMMGKLWPIIDACAVADEQAKLEAAGGNLKFNK